MFIYVPTLLSSFLRLIVVAIAVDTVQFNWGMVVLATTKLKTSDEETEAHNFYFSNPMLPCLPITPDMQL
jgi:heme O synthase-like polyprenyltransferase